MKYLANKSWAGRVWVWDRTLNKLKDGDMLELVYDTKTNLFSKTDLLEMIEKGVIIKKPQFNKLTNSDGVQYGFPVNILKTI